MKYYRIQIDTDSTKNVYDSVSQLLGILPVSKPANIPLDNPYEVWTYEVIKDASTNFDFINEFLALIEPKFDDLMRLGIERENIAFWLRCKYNQAYELVYSPREMKRLGESGIALYIDCEPMSDRSSTEEIVTARN